LKIYTIKVPIYDTVIKILCKSTRKEMEAYIFKTYGYELTPSTLQIIDASYFSLDGVQFIWLAKYDKSIERQSILQHEIFHLTSTVLRAHGLSLSEHSDEAFAYYHQYVVKQILTKLNRYYEI
jgi:hypothetical protein